MQHISAIARNEMRLTSLDEYIDTENPVLSLQNSKARF